MYITGNQRRHDFAGQQLSGAIFCEADLHQADFSGSNLERAVFLNCFAAEACFERAACIGLRAHGTSFYRCSFRSAGLRDALFWNCVLAGADLRGADLKRITLTLDCNSFEEIRMDRATSAELAYLFGRAQSAHRRGWLDVVGDRDLIWLDRVFSS